MTDEHRPQSAVEFAKAAGQLAAATRCTDVVLLDVSSRSQVAHYFLIATGTSARQMTTVADQIAELGENMGFKPWRISGAESARWILIDCVDVVVHLFDPASRAFYDLEMLWGDCPRVELELPTVGGQTPSPQSDETDAALEAAQEIIEAAMEMDDELTLLDMDAETSQPSTEEAEPQSVTDHDSGTISAPPDDQSIRYESYSIEITEGEPTTADSAPAPRKAPKTPPRRPKAKTAIAKKAAAQKPKAKTSARSKPAKQAAPAKRKVSPAKAKTAKAKPAKIRKAASAGKKATVRTGSAKGTRAKSKAAAGAKKGKSSQPRKAGTAARSAGVSKAKPRGPAKPSRLKARKSPAKKRK
jgi:ribosome-associated protein